MLDRRACILGTAALLAAPARAQPARDLTIASLGGALQEAQRATLFRPFADATSRRVLEETWTGGIATLRARRLAGEARWDLVLLEGDALRLACEEGLLLPLEAAPFGGPAAFVPGAVQPCGIGHLVSAMLLSWDRSRVPVAPQGWADLFDPARLAGRRALRRTARGTLEMALLAEGVPPAALTATLATPEGVERAFAQLARIRDLTAWWDRPAQPGLWLAAGEVALAAADQGRIMAQVAEGADLGIVWTRSLQAPLFWAIVAGSPNLAQALEFLAFASATPQQASMADRIAAAPALRAASPAAGGQGPHAPQTRATAIAIDDGFWAGPGVALEARLAAFAAS